MAVSSKEAKAMIEKARRVFVYVYFTDDEGTYVRAYKGDVLSNLTYRDTFYDEPIRVNIGGENGDDVYIN